MLSQPSSSNIARDKAAKVTSIVSILVNCVLTIVQIIFGILTHSYSLVADAIHSLSDLLSDFVVLVANRLARQRPDAKHPYGHFRYETIAVLVIAFLLVAVGAQIIISSVNALQSTESMEVNAGLAFFIALFAIISKELLYRYMAKTAKRVNSTLIMSNALHARSDAFSSFVVAVGLAANFFGLGYADLVASLIVGAMIAYMGLKMAWDSLMDLADRSVDKATLERLSTAISGTDGVLAFHDLKTRKAGDFIFVEVHLDLPSTMTIVEGHQISEAVNQQIKAAEPRVISVLTHFDPIEPEGDTPGQCTHG